MESEKGKIVWCILRSSDPVITQFICTPVLQGKIYDFFF